MLTISKFISELNVYTGYLNLKDNDFYMCEEKANNNNFRVELTNMQSLLQEKLAEIFRLKEDAKLINKEYTHIIEDLLSPIKPEESSILIKLIIFAYDSITKLEMFLSNCLNCIANSKNAKSRALHMKY